MKKTLRTKILEEATDLFMDQGFLATSTHQIAKNLGVTQPAIYHHFPNKEALYIEVLREFSSPVRNKLVNIMAQSESPKQALFEMSSHLTQSHPVNFNVMMDDMNKHLSEKAFGDIFRIYYETYFKSFEEVFTLLEDDLSPNFSLNLVVNHFLRGLSSYIINDPQDMLDVSTFVTLFLEGALKR